MKLNTLGLATIFIFAIANVASTEVCNNEMYVQNDSSSNYSSIITEHFSPNFYYSPLNIESLTNKLFSLNRLISMAQSTLEYENGTSTSKIEVIKRKRGRKSCANSDHGELTLSKYKFVYKIINNKSYWRARIVRGRNADAPVSLGLYETEEDAAKVVNQYFETVLGITGPNDSEKMFTNPQRPGRSRFKYVSRHIPNGKINWLAKIHDQDKMKYTKGVYCKTEKDAARTVDKMLMDIYMHPVNQELLLKDTQE